MCLAREARRGSVVWSVAGTLACLWPAVSPASSATLPIPCVAGSCGANGPQSWVTSGAAHAVRSGNAMTVTQQTEDVVLNWQSFNISSNGTVTFKQPDATAVALNQIFQANPSKILGALNSNGSIYLINQNGIVFGDGAQVNTGSLIASSLNITPAALSGVLNAALNGSPAFASFVDANGDPLPSGPVQVASGAKISSGKDGEIMLFGPEVTNEGSLSTNGGQVILAAGDSVYLAASTDPNLRGLLIEVGHGGTATNAAAGQIVANDGNVTLVGLIVNQLGRISATTAVQQNGSIYLLAQDGASDVTQVGATVATLIASQAGTLNLGAGSHTDVTPDLTSTATAVDATPQPQSQVVLDGQNVTLAGGSEITATSGNVSITAAVQPEAAPESFSAQPGAGRLVIDPGASINVSGANISLPMSSNVIPVQLRGTELANSPEQRNSPLYGQTVYIDIRQTGVLNGTAWVGSPIGDLSGYVAAIQRNVLERSLTGGSITLNSDGAAFVSKGADLNISGGSIAYQSGYVNTTMLLGTNGQIYNIAQADPSQTYVGIVNSYSFTDPKWGVTQTFGGVPSQYQQGYVEGKDAGSLTIQAPSVVLDGNVTASTVVGPYQRQLPTPFDTATSLYRPVDEMPLSGQLTLGLADGGGNGGDNYLLPNVVFSDDTVLNTLTGPNGAPFNPLTDPLSAGLDTVTVRPDLFGPDGIDQLDIYSNGSVSIPANIALQMPVAGELTVRAGAIDLAGSVTAHDGSVSLTAGTTETIQGGSASSTLTLGPHSSIDVSGQWINDQPTPSAAPGTLPLSIGGGTVKISASGGTPLDLVAGSSIDVSGGAQRTAAGTIVGGAAGAITVSIGPSSNGTPVPVAIGSGLEAYGLAQGGTLSLSANSICVAAANCAAGQTGLLWAPTSLFSADGFGTVSLSSNFGDLDVLPGTQLSPLLLNFAVLGDAATAPSGTPLKTLTTLTQLPQLNRAPVNVSLAVNLVPPSALVAYDESTYATAGVLNIGTGATISLDPGASLSLTSNTSIVIDGTLSAPAGNLSIATTTTLPIVQFLSSQGIWLQSDAHLSTQGVAQLQTNDLGQSTGSVLNGGNISIAANRGYLITAPGSSIDASGTAAEVNLAQNVSTQGTIAATPTLTGSNGGTISLAAAEGMLLNGSVSARAGDAPGAGGGALDIILDGNLHGSEPGGIGTVIFPFSPRQIILTNGAPVVVEPQYSVPDEYNGVALIPTDTIEAGGFSALSLAAKNLFDSGGPVGESAPVSTASIVFPQNTTLQLPASIRLDAPEISTPNGAHVQLEAAYIGLGYDDSQAGAQIGYSTSAGPGTVNSGTFQVRAGLVDFIGSLGLGGFSSSTIESTGDIRFIGVESSGPTPLPIAGTLVAQGSLLLQADELYPTTLTQFDVTVSGASIGSNILRILPGGTPGDAVLSAGGQLTLQADAIQQDGVLRAPFGSLVLDAPQINLAAGSVTSVSGAGEVIPFGSTQAGTDWVYDLPQGQFAVYTQTGPPAKSVELNGNDITVVKGATVDLSGGGDLQATEFVPGVGGTVDVLSNSNTANPGQFAILPLQSLQYAPYDPQAQVGFSYAPGSSIQLAGGGGVPAGTYAILPASYALLPGAYLVQPVRGFQDLAPGQTVSELDGSTVVAGRFATAGTTIASTRTQGFDIRPGTAVQQLAQYTITSANTFFSSLAAANNAAPPPLPKDAGQLELLAGQQLEFLGNLETAAASGGRGAQVDISASQIDVANGTSAAGSTPGVVTLDAAQLNALGAQSLLIGGTRVTTTGEVTAGDVTQAGDITQIVAGASSVVIDPGVTLSGSEIMLTASDSLTVSEGAVLDATGTAAAVPNEYNLSGVGAFLRVSTGAQVPVTSSNPGSTSGNLLLEPGTVLKASGSATLEASGNLQSGAQYKLPGASLAFDASQISLGSAPAGTSGLALSPGALSALELGQLALTSAAPIDVYGSNALSVPGSLMLVTPGITAASSDAGIAFDAKQIMLEGAPAAGPAGTVTSSGDLALTADQIVLDGGALSFNGFRTASLNGATTISASAPGSITADGPLTLQTASLTTANGVSYQIGSLNGSVQVLGPVTAARSTAAAPGVGGQLALSGSSVAIDTAITLPSGALTLSATGPAATDDVTLGAAAAINVAGTTTTFDSVPVAGPGGNVSIDVAAGSVAMASGAQIDLSAGNATAAGGALLISAPNGMASLQGTLRAVGGPGAEGGQFTLDVAQLPDLTGLNASLNAGGFTGLRSFWQQGAGDVTLAPGGLVRAATVSISNDGGSINVLGDIDASGSAGGSVSLAAQNAVEISGRIDVSASGANQAGGSIGITSTSGIVQIASSASLDLAGGAGGAGGTLDLTVPRSALTGMLGAAPGTAAPISLGGSIQGAQQVQVEGLATYDAADDAIANTISAPDIASSGSWYTDAASFMSQAPAVTAALAGSSGLNVSVVPGIEIQSSGDLTLATNWDLSTWRFNGAPGVLTLRAAGNLLVQQSLSDGFDGVTGAGAFVLPNAPGQSWSYRLIAGADLGASNLMAVEPAGAPGGRGNIEIAAGVTEGGFETTPLPVMVRTGTGDIDVAAAGDLEFGNRASVIYTAGENSGAGVPLPELANLAYPTAGGNIDVNVGGDILGAPTNQLVTSWLWRAGQQPGNLSNASATGWTVNYQWFEENIGALAGGNVSITAGGNISQLSVAVPTIGVQVGGTGFAQNVLQITGGGTLSVQSGGNIIGGSYFVGGGTGTLQAGDMIGADLSGAPQTTMLAPILALGDAAFNVSARDGVTLESVLNPFLLPQAIAQGASERSLSLFSTYTNDSAVSVVSTAGDITLVNQPGIDGVEAQFNSMRFSTAQQEDTFLLYPGTLNAAALTGNLNIDGQVTLSPSPTGNLNLFAAQNVVFSPQFGSVLMSGLTPGSLANPLAPVQFLIQEYALLFAPPLPGTAETPIHSADPNPARVVALNGDVSDAFLSYIPKAVDVVAGQDITELTLLAVNLSPADLSVISAGGSITYASPRDVNGILIPESQSIAFEGPGSALIEAGGNINLGTSAGVTTVGNLLNPDLPTGGANLSVLAGATVANADLAAFTTRYLADESTYDAALISYVQARTDTPVVSKAQALAIFATLSREQQFMLCQQILDDEIRTGGSAAAAPGPQHNNYSRSFLALSTLFPNSTTATGKDSAATVYPGSLSLYFSQIYTLDGGDISLLVPGGSVNVGLSTPPTAFGITKSPSQLGIVAQSTGDVSSVSYGDFSVNQSRVFAADGGNILVWSTDGNIDAGRGAKTAISAPAPTVTINAQGQIETVFPAALQGSGIQALATTAGVSPGDVDLFAPQGVVNASDAGIVAGNLTIGATAVLGRNNITVSGVSVGVPVETTGLGATFSGSSSVAGSSTNVATATMEASTQQTPAPIAQTALGWLDVFLIGLGEENCKPDDLECLKRQQIK